LTRENELLERGGGGGTQSSFFRSSKGRKRNGGKGFHIHQPRVVDSNGAHEKEKAFRETVTLFSILAKGGKICEKRLLGGGIKGSRRRAGKKKKGSFVTVLRGGKVNLEKGKPRKKESAVTGFGGKKGGGRASRGKNFSPVKKTPLERTGRKGVGEREKILDPIFSQGGGGRGA